MEQLKPCECGEVPKLAIVYIDDDEVGNCVICTKCRQKTEEYKTSEEAIEAWNRRAK